MKKIFLLTLIATLLFGSNPLFALRADAQTSAPVLSKRFAPDAKAYKFADKMLKKMTDEEKVGQLVSIGINARFANQDNDYFRDLQRHIVENKLGGIVLFGAPLYESVVMVNRMQASAKVPLLIALDAETGIGMRFNDAANFPWNMAVAATGNTDLARRMGVITGREAKAIGVHQVYAPVLDVNNNADNPVINVRSYGENPSDVARFGTAFIEGVQSQNILATAKHFPGHGDTAVDSHRGLPIINVSRQRLDEIELVPFREAIKNGVASIMVAHIGLPQIDPTEIKPIKSALRVDAEEGGEIVSENATIPATLSPKIQTEMLRKELGFDGLIVTDAMSMSGLTLYVTQEEAGVQAFLAGADILEKPADVDAMIRGLRQAVKSGRISQERLNQSVRKILAWKYATNLFKGKITPIDQIDRIVAGRETYALADELAAQAVTLIRNDGGLLPLKKDKKVFVLGISNGFDGDATMGTTVRTLRENGISFKAEVLQENSTRKEIEQARAEAKEADIVIAAMFGRVRSGAKNSVGLPESGVGILRELENDKKPLIGISYGNPYFAANFPEMPTFIVSYGDMTSLQRATVRAMLGLAPFQGKLPITVGNHPRGTGLILAKP